MQCEIGRNQADFCNIFAPRLAFSWRFAFFAGVALVLSLEWGYAAPPEISFWVWNRVTPLSNAELAELQQLPAHSLYWPIAQMTWHDGHWRFQVSARPPQFISSLDLIAVVRLECNAHDGLTGNGMDELLDELARIVGGDRTVKLQIDYDCPDRLLNDYAEAIHRMHERFPALSVTALAHWIESAPFNAVAVELTEVVPMFYDLEADPRPTESTPNPRPIIDQQEAARQLAAWSKTSARWRAGLPNFSRVSIYDPSGNLRGHLRTWSWADICFNPNLRTVMDRCLPSTALYRVESTTRLGATKLGPGDWLAARLTDREALAITVRNALASGARGIVYFRLPDESDATGWSMPQLKDLQVGMAQLRLRRRDQALELCNDSESDLPPRLCTSTDDRDRGYALEIDAPGPIWREAIAGEFSRMQGHLIMGAAAKPVPLQLATRLTCWFPNLRAHGCLISGTILFAVNARIDTIRYRVLNGRTSTEWRTLE